MTALQSYVHRVRYNRSDHVTVCGGTTRSHSGSILVSVIRLCFMPRVEGYSYPLECKDESCPTRKYRGDPASCGPQRLNLRLSNDASPTSHCLSVSQQLASCMVPLYVCTCARVFVGFICELRPKNGFEKTLPSETKAGSTAMHSPCGGQCSQWRPLNGQILLSTHVASHQSNQSCPLSARQSPNLPKE